MDRAMHKEKGSRRTALTPIRWAGLPMLQTAHRLNEWCFALLAETVKNQGASTAYSAVYGLKELWAQVDARACERAGRCPVLLLDLNFQRPDWWRRVRRGETGPLRAGRPSALFNADRAAPLLREILMESWSIGRSMPSAASLLFGMAAPVNTEIAGLSAPDVDRVVLEYTGCLRPRWEESRTFWKRLLEAAVGADEEALANVHLHCFQLLGSDLVLRYG
jgi:hypothetical protein